MKLNCNESTEEELISMLKKTEMRKAVIFIVEGKSDKKALEHIFKVIYKHKNVTFEFTRGDVTSDETLTLNDIELIIYGKVEAYMKEKKLNKNHIWQIVQIFDTDGTYIQKVQLLQVRQRSFIILLRKYLVMIEKK